VTFRSANPTGHYELALSSPVDHSVCSRLIDLAREEVRPRTHTDTQPYPSSCATNGSVPTTATGFSRSFWVCGFIIFKRLALPASREPHHGRGRAQGGATFNVRNLVYEGGLAAGGTHREAAHYAEPLLYCAPPAWNMHVPRTGNVTFDFTSTLYPKGQSSMASDAFSALLAQLRTALRLQAHDPPLYQGQTGSDTTSSPTRSRPRGQSTSPTKVATQRGSPRVSAHRTGEHGEVGGDGAVEGSGEARSEESGMFPERAEFMVMTTGSMRNDIRAGAARAQPPPSPSRQHADGGSGRAEMCEEPRGASGPPELIRSYHVEVIQQLRVQSADLVLDAAQAAQVRKHGMK
jgi:hypothetical protein